MLPHSGRRAAVCVSLALMAFSASACGERGDAPAIGFTYNWGDAELEAFVRHEIHRGASAPRDSIQLVTSREGGWQTYGETILAAEVSRASLISARDEVVVVVGPGGSREALLVAPVYRTAGMPVLVPTATSRLLREAGDHLFLLSANDSIQGEFIATFADSALGAKRLAVFYVPDEYGIGLAAGTASTVAARGLTLVARSPLRLVQDCLTAADRAHYDGLAAGLAAAGPPDAVVVAARTTEVACLSRALRARWPGIHILGGDGVYLSTSFFDRAGSNADGIHLVAFWHPDLPSDRSRAFRDAWQRAYGTTARHGDAVFYDAAMLAATAVRTVGADRKAITAYLRSLGVTRPPYEGVTGPLAFGPGAPRSLLMVRTEAPGAVLVDRR